MTVWWCAVVSAQTVAINKQTMQTSNQKQINMARILAMHRNTRDVSTTGFGFGFGQRSNESPKTTMQRRTLFFWLFFVLFFLVLGWFSIGHAGSVSHASRGCF